MSRILISPRPNCKHFDYIIDNHQELFAYNGDDFPYTQNPELHIDDVPDLKSTHHFSRQSPLSPKYLRPDFEEEHRELFMKAQDYYHRYHYEHATVVIRSYLENLTPSSNIAATSSFEVLYHLSQKDTPCIFSGPTAMDWSDSQHIEYLIARVAECAREWIFHTPKDSPARKQEMDEFLLFGLNEICFWVPMPPVKGAVLTDAKIFGRILFHSILASSNSPAKTNSKWETLMKHEQIDFENLCYYLLQEKRIDLLINTVNCRNPNTEFTQRIMKLALLNSLSLCQSLSCQAGTGPGMVVFEYLFDSNADLFYRLNRIIFNGETAGKSFGWRSITPHIASIEDFRFCNLRLLRNLFWRAAAMKFFTSRNVPTLDFLGHLRYDFHEKDSTTCSYGQCCYELISYTRQCWELTFYASDIPQTSCPTCTARQLDITRLEQEILASDFRPNILYSSGKFIEFLNCALPQLPIQITATLAEDVGYHCKNGSLNMFSKEMTLGLLYLEKVLEKSINTSNPHFHSIYLADFLLTAYELWFSPIIHLANTHDISPGLIRCITDKLAFAAAIWLHFSDPKQFDRRSASRCIYHLIQSAQYQESENARKILSIALRLAKIHLDIALQRGNQYDIFEICFLGASAAQMKPFSQNLTHTDFGPHLAKHSLKAKFARMRNVGETDFPELLLYNEDNTALENLSINQNLHRLQLEFSREFDGYWVLGGQPIKRSIRRIKIQGGLFFDDYDSSSLTSIIQLIDYLDNRTAEIRRDTTNNRLRWLDNINFSENFEAFRNSSFKDKREGKMVTKDCVGNGAFNVGNRNFHLVVVGEGPYLEGLDLITRSLKTWILGGQSPEYF